MSRPEGRAPKLFAMQCSYHCKQQITVSISLLQQPAGQEGSLQTHNQGTGNAPGVLYGAECGSHALASCFFGGGEVWELWGDGKGPPCPPKPPGQPQGWNVMGWFGDADWPTFLRSPPQTIPKDQKQPLGTQTFPRPPIPMPPPIPEDAPRHPCDLHKSLTGHKSPQTLLP